MRWPEEYVLALCQRKKQAQGLPNLVVSALLASADINKAKHRLDQSKVSTKIQDFVHARYDATSVQRSGESREIENDMDQNLPVFDIGVGIGSL